MFVPIIEQLTRLLVILAFVALIGNNMALRRRVGELEDQVEDLENAASRS